MTNDSTQASTAATQQACGFRWKIGPLHREGKPVRDWNGVNIRKPPSTESHWLCFAFLVWVRLKALAVQAGRAVSHLKHGLLDDYLVQQLKNPSLKMVLT